MFERYTEKARRVIFFARYEASEFGSPVIDTDHLLLGLVREEKQLCFRWIPKAQPEAIRQAIEGWSERGSKIPTTVDMPLSQASKDVLEHAREESDRLNSKPIGTEHLLLGLLQEKCKASDCYAKWVRTLGNCAPDSSATRDEKTRLRQPNRPSSIEYAPKSSGASVSERPSNSTARNGIEITFWMA
jgi:ATP-dependent Clp protease ATP-binding subunit ClpC